MEEQIQLLYSRHGFSLPWSLLDLPLKQYHIPILLVDNLKEFFGSTEISILIGVWVLTGSIFGIVMSILINIYVSRSGKLNLYDRISYAILFMGMLGYVLIGVCYQYKVSSIVVYVFLMIFIGIGSIGYYGVMFLSLVETYHPINSLIIGSIITAGASLYGGIANSLGEFTGFNIYYILAAITFLPFIYVCLTFKTNFKRYVYYPIDKNRFDLISLEDFKSISNNQNNLLRNGNKV